MGKVSKPAAVWLVVWMVVFTVSAGVPAFALSGAPAPIGNAAIEAAVDQVIHVKPCSQVPYANILADPVNTNFQPDPMEYKILTLTEEVCGQMKTGSGKWIRTRLRKDFALAVPLSGKGDFLAVACGNNFVPEGPLTGKYFECPVQNTCPPPEIREIQIPGPERVVYRDRESSPPIMQPAHVKTSWWCARGGWRTTTCVAVGILVVGTGAAAAGGHGSNKCNTCAGGAYPKP